MWRGWFAAAVVVVLFASGVWIMVVAERPGDNTGRVADFLTCRIGLGSDFRSRAKPGRDGRGCGPDVDLLGAES